MLEATTACMSILDQNLTGSYEDVFCMFLQCMNLLFRSCLDQERATHLMKWVRILFDEIDFHFIARAP